MANRIGGKFLLRAKKRITQRGNGVRTSINAKVKLTSNKKIIQQSDKGKNKIILTVNRKTKIRVKKI